MLNYKKLSIVSLVLLIVVIITACSNGGMDNTTITNSIKGTVTSGGSAVENVSVTVTETDITTNTDANGDYMITGITNGSYSVSFSDSNITDVTKNVTIGPDGKTTYTVDVSQ